MIPVIYEGELGSDRFFFQWAHSAKPQKPNYLWRAFNVSYYTEGVTVIQPISPARREYQLQLRNTQRDYQCPYTGEMFCSEDGLWLMSSDHSATQEYLSDGADKHTAVWMAACQSEQGQKRF